MSLVDWDNELTVVSSELATIREAHTRTRMTGNKALVARKVAIIQMQINVERNFARIKKLVGRDLMLMPRERTLVHWSQVFLEHAEKFHALRSKLLTRGLWLKLIMTRAMGPEGDEHAELDADDLVALSIRQDSLVKTEKYLAESLAKLKRRRKDLMTKYEQLGIADANRSASRSMASRLGLNSTDALQGPGVKALESFVKQASVPLLAPDAEAFVARGARRIERRADSLLEICRAAILSRLRDPLARPTVRTEGKFQAAMLQLDDLEDETRQAMGQMLDKAPPPVRLGLRSGVQKS